MPQTAHEGPAECRAIQDAPVIAPLIITDRRTEAELHRDFAHPDWEYEITTGPRKAWWESEQPPGGDGWVRNVEAGRNGWERFEYHEESYWRRPKISLAIAHDLSSR